MNISTQLTFVYNTLCKTYFYIMNVHFNVWNINRVVSINNLWDLISEETQQSHFPEKHDPTTHAHKVNALMFMFSFT
jgi:hypothetical protein